MNLHLSNSKMKFKSELTKRAKRVRLLKISTVILLAIILPASKVAAQDSNQPKADPRAIVTDGGARFTVLTPRMIRMEWSNNQAFVDDASFVAVNRKLP